MPAHETHWKDSINQLGGALQIPDLRGRLLFIAGMFALFIIGINVPAPFVRPEADRKTDVVRRVRLDRHDVGRRVATPLYSRTGNRPLYQRLHYHAVIGYCRPGDSTSAERRGAGRKVISTYTRIGTVVLAVLQGTGFSIFLYQQGAVDPRFGWMGIIPLVIVMTAGTSFLMWMGEQLTDKGIGNGISLIIFAGILIRLPNTFGMHHAVGLVEFIAKYH